MRRREFIGLIGGTTAAWPLAARAQQPDRMRRIGALAGFNDPDLKVFQQELERLGWSEGRNIHIDHRYAPAGSQVQTLAKELVALQPEVIFAQSRPVTAALQKETHTIPIVFTFVIDPVGAGFVASLPRPGSNLTGFMVFEPSVLGKWLAMLKEIAPKTSRVALLANSRTAVYYDYLLQAAEVAAPQLGIERLPFASKTMPPRSSARSPRSQAYRTAASLCCQTARRLSITLSSSRWQRAIACQQFTTATYSSPRAV